MNTKSQPRSGLPLALGAYLIWGLLPLYLRWVHDVPPFEFVGWRVIFTLPVCFAAIALRRQWRPLRIALTSRRTMLTLAGSSLLIGGNWLVYIAAIQGGHLFAASLGYYINPLANVMAGTLFLGERLTRRQWLAVGLAAIGVSLLAWGAYDMLAISLALAISFCGYGLVRKLAPVESLPGLTIESVILLLPACLIVAYYAALPGGSAIGQSAGKDLLVAGSGMVTAVPLLLFAAAARRMDYSALGMVQFLAPTIVFALGLFVFHEPLRPVQLACFVLIWAAIAVFVADIVLRRRVSP